MNINIRLYSSHPRTKAELYTCLEKQTYVIRLKTAK